MGGTIAKTTIKEKARLSGLFSMKAKPGSYALIFELDVVVSLLVGRLGNVVLEPGFYVYTGSAFGPGGVKARTSHHQAISQRPHWHLDYLRPHMTLLEIWASYDQHNREHLWAQVIAEMRGASIPVVGFGASDCACISHFIRLPYKPAIAGFRKRVRKKEPGHAPVHSESCEP